jgi:hypothetical protein
MTRVCPRIYPRAYDSAAGVRRWARRGRNRRDRHSVSTSSRCCVPSQRGSTQGVDVSAESRCPLGSATTARRPLLDRTTLRVALIQDPGAKEEVGWSRKANRTGGTVRCHAGPMHYSATERTLLSGVEGASTSTTSAIDVVTTLRRDSFGMQSRRTAPLSDIGSGARPSRKGHVLLCATRTGRLQTGR